ncbi:MAG TPA: uracil-DNA glycosylase [Steroidobacteraceae bacterium]
MNEARDLRRREYLAALGIDVWLPRGAAARATAPAAALPAVIAPVGGAAPVAAGDPSPQWERLRAEVAACVKCALHSTRTQTVFGVGNLRSQWLVIGEAPGAEEDRQGEPFVGRAGQLLNAMLRAIGLPRERVYIANMLKCRPPGNRDPKPEELACCRPYLLRQIALLEPQIILVVGRIAAQNLLATDAPLGKLRGTAHRFGETGTPLVVTYHPAYLLRSPGEKRKAWEDLKFARALQREQAAQKIDGHST